MSILSVVTPFRFLYLSFYILPVEIVRYIREILGESTWLKFMKELRRESIHINPAFYIHNYKTIPSEKEIEFICKYFNGDKFLIKEKEDYIISQTNKNTQKIKEISMTITDYDDKIDSIKQQKLPKTKYILSKSNKKYKKTTKNNHKSIKKDKDRRAVFTFDNLFCRCAEKINRFYDCCENCENDDNYGWNKYDDYDFYSGWSDDEDYYHHHF